MSIITYKIDFLYIYYTHMMCIMQQTKTENYKFFINFFHTRPEVKNSTSARPKWFGRVFRPEVNIKQLKNAHKWAFNENNSTRSGALDLDQKWRGNTSPPPLRGKLLGDFRHDRRGGGPQSNGFGDPLLSIPILVSISVAVSVVVVFFSCLPVYVFVDFSLLL